MISTHSLIDRWMLTGAICGMCSIIVYLAAVFIPMPLVLTHLCAFAFGPLLAVGCLGLYYTMTFERPSVTVTVATLMGLGGAVSLLIMITTQQSIFLMTDQALQISEAGASDELRRAILNVERLSRKGLNAVQLGMDVAWDIFISAAVILYASAMWSHRAFGWIISISGLTLGLLLLTFNLWYFPIPPINSNSIDWGPFVALWLIIVFSFNLAFRFSRSRFTGSASDF